MTELLHDELLKALEKEDRVLAVVGAGVSIAATENAESASWQGLVKHGIEWSAGLGRIEPDQAARWKIIADSGDSTELLLAAEFVSQKLEAPEGGDWRDWLNNSVGSLRALRPGLLEAIVDLPVKLATTNYDGLLSAAAKRKVVTWQQGNRVRNLFQNEEDGILHLHGFWREHESVVLGIRSYDKIMGDEYTQNLLRTLTAFHTLLFIGFGEGLVDPNFEALRRWMARALSGHAHRHFRLCREKELKRLKRIHRADERITPLSYGQEYEDLEGFLRTLARELQSAGEPPPKPPETRATSHSRLPAKPVCFGRDGELTQVVDFITEKEPRPVLILGSAGMGKSTLALAAVHHGKVMERFGERRYFIRCNGARDAGSMVSEIGAGLGIKQADDLLDAILFDLSHQGTLMVLDNVETPWERDTESVENLLTILSNTPETALVVTIRGENRPLGPDWQEPIHIEPLTPKDSKKLFLSLAGEHRNDPNLTWLNNAVDHVPLAVSLMAYQAQGLSDLSELRQSWEKRRIAILRRSAARQANTSVEASIQLSVKSPRMNSASCQLLAALGILPAGIARPDVTAIFPKHGRESTRTLIHVGLGYSEEGRLRTLAPIREYAASNLIDDIEDWPAVKARITSHYIELAGKGHGIGREGGSEIVARLTPELSNLEGVLKEALDDPRSWEKACWATLGLGILTSVSGSERSVAKILEQASIVAEKNDKTLYRAYCLESLGQDSQRQSQLDKAEQYFQEALRLYRQLEHPAGEANCILGLGRIAHTRSRIESAKQYLNKAQSLFMNNNNLVGEANCTLELGHLSAVQGEYEAATERFQKARRMYQDADRKIGEANCASALAEIASLDSRFEEAKDLSQQALELYEEVGSLLGKMNCIRRLANIAVHQRAYDGAEFHYYRALVLFRRVKAIIGIANCTKRLADVARRRQDRGQALLLYQEADQLYEKASSPLGRANCLRSIGLLQIEAGKFKNAAQNLRKALRLYEDLGSLQGRANCILGLAALDAAEGRAEEAQQGYASALKLYQQLSDMHGVAVVYKSKAAIANTPEERMGHLSKALEALWKTGTEELVRELHEEFPELEMKQ